MKDELIKLEIAILAKEKGFDEEALAIYYDPPKQHSFFGDIKQGPGYGRKYNYYKNKPKDGSKRFHATTQSLLQKWLREIHNIHVNVEYHNAAHNCYTYKIIFLDKNKKRKTYFGVYSNSYEEALEEGLFEALKLI